MEQVRDILFENEDLDYKRFNDRIIVTNYKTIGVRIPVLKRIAKTINDTNFKAEYYEEIVLKGLVIANDKDPLKSLKMIDEFLDLIDSWAICDTVCSACKSFKKIPFEVLNFVHKNIASSNPWRVRFAFVTLLNYFVKEEYLNLIFDYCDNDKNDHYYVMMAKAWLISMCYVKHPKQTLEYLKKSNIDDVTFNKAISKICDSYQVSKESKIALKKMKKIAKKA